MSSFLVKQWSIETKQGLLLDSINLELPLGQLTSIVGASGAGKTLLVKSFMGSYPLGAKLSGEIWYRQELLVGREQAFAQEFRGKILAYVAQNAMTAFNPRQMIRSHFQETLQSHGNYSNSRCEEIAVTFLTKVGLAHLERLLTAYPWELSGGTLQRVMLALILCLKPEILILDEPTSSLDSYSSFQIKRVLKALLEEGQTIFLVTHDYSLIEELGGQVLVLDQGKVLEFASYQEMRQSPKKEGTRELFSLQTFARLIDETTGMPSFDQEL